MRLAIVRTPETSGLTFVSAGVPLALMLLLGVSFATPMVAPLRAVLTVNGQTHGKPKPPAVSAPSHAAPEAAVPFHTGERLDYRVLWSKYSVNAATVEFQVVERGSFFGHTAWHFRALAHTIDTMRILYPLDDQFDSYTETAQLTSVEYEMYLHEQGKQQNNSWRMTTNGGAAPADAAAAQVVPGTRDPIGVIFALRAADWQKNPEFRAPVFDGRHLYDIVARLEQASAPVTVPAGQFMASQVAVRLFEHGQEITDTHFTMWLAQDAARTPVLIEADVAIGTARVELMTKP